MTQRQYKLIYDVDCGDQLTGMYIQDRSIDADWIVAEQCLSRNPYLAGVLCESGYWEAKFGRIILMYEILDDEKVVRLLAARLGANTFAVVGATGHTDTLPTHFELAQQVIHQLLPQLHRHPRQVEGSVRQPDGTYEVQVGRVTLHYQVSEGDRRVTLTTAQVLD